MRYSGGEYFFILDTQHHFVMHPVKPELEGKSGAEMRDPSGKPLIQELVRTALASERGGAVNYAFAKPGSDKPVAKVSSRPSSSPGAGFTGPASTSTTSTRPSAARRSTRR